MNRVIALGVSLVVVWTFFGDDSGLPLLGSEKNNILFSAGLVVLAVLISVFIAKYYYVSVWPVILSILVISMIDIEVVWPAVIIGIVGILYCESKDKLLFFYLVYLTSLLGCYMYID